MPDVLPAAGFLTFRAACTRLPAQAAGLVDRVWRTGFLDIRDWLPRHLDYSDPQATAITLALPLSLHLAKTFHRCESEGEALVRLRATQAALLHSGLLLNHRPGLNTGPATGRLRSHLTPSRAAVINRQLNPAYAAAATIYLLFPFGRSTDRTSYWTADELTLADLSPHGHFLRIRDGDIPVPTPARPALRAYRTYRRTIDAAEDPDLLFPPQPGGRHARTLADLGMRDLPKTPRPERLTVYDHATAWMTERHLSLRSLITATRSLQLRSPTWT